MTPEVFDKLRKEDFKKSKEGYNDNILDIVSGFIPVLNLLKARTFFQDYKDWKMGKKILDFLSEFTRNESNQDELNKMASEIESINGESFFETMIDTLDRIDNENKARILANILRHSVSGQISRENFLRHSWILANVPNIDLQQLHKYTVDYYQPASSEILASNGLIRETILDAGDIDSADKGGSKYGLTTLGEEMLHFGLYAREWEYKGGGRQIPALNWQTVE